MQIRLLGTGTPNPSFKRMSSGCLVETREDVLVFDHGAGAFHRLLETGIDVTRVSHLFFSHLHFDHCLDYARLVLTRWDQAAGKIPELKVYGPAHLRKMTDLLFGEGGVFDPDLIARTRHEPSVQTYISRGGTPPRQRPAPQVHVFEHGTVIHEQEWRLEVVTVPHAQPYLASAFAWILLKDPLPIPETPVRARTLCGSSRAAMSLSTCAISFPGPSRVLSGLVAQPGIWR